MDTPVRHILNLIDRRARHRGRRRPRIRRNRPARLVVADGTRRLGLGLSPLRRARPLGILPGPHIAELAASRTRTVAAKLLGQVLLGNLAQQLGLVMAAEDVDLLDGDGVEEALDDAEDGGEAPGRVDQIEFAQPLRVVVLRDGRGLLHVAVHRRHPAQADAFQVHDRAARLQQRAGLARTRRQPRVRHLFVFHHQVLQHPLRRRDLVHGVEVDFAELFDVDGSAVLRKRARSVDVDG